MAKNTADREAHARLRTYRARTTVHDEQVKRRTRDNRWAGIAVVAAFALAIVGQIAYFGVGPGAPTPSASAAAATGTVPSASLAAGRDWTGSGKVGDVPVTFTLNGALAPQAVSSEIQLITDGFYENNECHRIVTSGIFILQCGDPKGDGTGGPGYSFGPIENAPVDSFYPAGTIAMARQGNNAASNGSQFFIVYQDSTIPSDSVGGYTVIGRLTSGLAPLQQLISSTGVADGSSEGKPASPIVLSGFQIQ